MFCGFSARLSSVNARANACENRVLAAALRTATAAARAGFSERFRDRRCGGLPGARLLRYRRSRLCIEGLRHCRARRCGVDIANEAMLHMLSAGWPRASLFKRAGVAKKAFCPSSAMLRICLLRESVRRFPAAIALRPLLFFFRREKAAALFPERERFPFSLLRRRHAK